MNSEAERSTMMGMNNVVANLSGTQEGEYQIETSSGMLVNASIKAKIEGNINGSGREIPITIHNSIKIKGTRK